MALAIIIMGGASAQQHTNKLPEALQKLYFAEYAIANMYVDSVDEGHLVEKAIRAMLEELDPHSSYSTPKEVTAMNEPLRGDFEGIGISFNMVDDTLIVIQTIADGPSERVGILAGDRIVAVNDTAIAGVSMSKEEIMRRLRGPKGSLVDLSIVRRDIADTLLFTVTRDKIPVNSVDAHYLIRPGVGYIKLGNFSATTHKEIVEALDDLTAQGMESLILDLEQNGGGYLQAAVDVANEFLERGSLIVYTEGRRVPRAEYKARGGGKFTTGHIAVLVDSYTASAAEIVTGAIQDHGRGVIVGRRTFGKGLVQRPIDLPDKSMIRLTVSHYYTPSGRCIQKPYVKGQRADYAKDVTNRLKSGELTNEDSVHADGGIMPDIYVPLDTTKYTRYHRQLSAKGIIINTILHYVDSHRKALGKTYRTFNTFRDGYEVPSSLLEDLSKAGEEKGVSPTDDDEWNASVDMLSLQLKALIARDLWGMDEYYTIINESNDIILCALEAL